MKPWMIPWLFAVGLLGAVVFVSVFPIYASLVALGVGLALIPALLLRGRFPVDRDPDADVNYWRLKRP